MKNMKKTKTSSPDKLPSFDRASRRLAVDAALLALTLMLSYAESVLPLGGFLRALPGFRPGLANLGVLSAAYLTFSWGNLTLRDAALVSFGKVVLTAILFGNASSFLFSLFGGAAVLGMLACLRPVRCFSMIGISVLCAAAHNAGQLLAALLLMRTTAIFAYIPALLIASCLWGSVNGALMNLLFRRMTLHQYNNLEEKEG